MKNLFNVKTHGDCKYQVPPKRKPNIILEYIGNSAEQGLDDNIDFAIDVIRANTVPIRDNIIGGTHRYGTCTVSSRWSIKPYGNV